MELPIHKNIVFIPHIEYRLIKEIYSLACDGVYYCTYKELMGSGLTI
jgi:hypothetical protein